ncbi:MAG: hypothetical protein RL700_590, partial [Pseudomonadota bacterium]
FSNHRFFALCKHCRADQAAQKAAKENRQCAMKQVLIHGDPVGWLMHGLAHGPKLEGIELVEAVEAPIAQLLEGHVGVVE